MEYIEAVDATTAAPEDNLQTDLDNQNAASENPTSTDSPYLGLGVVGAMFGLIFFFNHQPSLGERAGSTVVVMLMAATFALPTFLWWRFYSRFGAFETLGKAWNVFTLHFAVVALLTGAATLMKSKDTVISEAEQQRQRALVGCAIGDQAYKGGDPLIPTNWTSLHAREQR